MPPLQEPDQLCFLGGQRQPHGGSGIIHDLIALTKLLKLQRSGQFPDEPVRIKVGQIHWNTWVRGLEKDCFFLLSLEDLFSRSKTASKMQNRRLGDMPMSPRFEQREQASPAARMQVCNIKCNIFISFLLVIAILNSFRIAK
jgi:hypothetical protein